MTEYFNWWFYAPEESSQWQALWDVFPEGYPWCTHFDFDWLPCVDDDFEVSDE